MIIRLSCVNVTDRLEVIRIVRALGSIGLLAAKLLVDSITALPVSRIVEGELRFRVDPAIALPLILALANDRSERGRPIWPRGLNLYAQTELGVIDLTVMSTPATTEGV